MTSDERLNIFEEELDLITIQPVRTFVEDCLLLTPEYFFEVAASDSSAHHPYWVLGKGGLVRHTKAVAKLGHNMSGTFYNVDKSSESTAFRVSAIVSACILHDSCKYGIPFDYRMHALHPYIPRVLFDKVTTSLLPEERNFIFTLIESHMGSYMDGGWSPIHNLTKITLSNNQAALIVHIADYVSSRNDYVDSRFVDVNKDMSRDNHLPYEPFPDHILEGLIIGAALETKSWDAIQRAKKDGSFDSLFSRVSSLRSPYSVRRKKYNLDGILETIKTNIDLFIVEGDVNA